MSENQSVKDFDLAVLLRMAGEGIDLPWSPQYISALDKLVSLGYAALTICPDGVPLYHLTKEGLTLVKGKENV